MADLSFKDICDLLACEGAPKESLFRHANEIKVQTVGSGVYLRGLIEYSNVCTKNCYYCGIRRDKPDCERYTLSSEQVLEAALFAIDEKYGSVVIQAGEITSEAHIDKIESLLLQIATLSRGYLGVTLSLGEQSFYTYHRWFEAGAHRYLLRIETSNEGLYKKVHPSDNLHDFKKRKNALHDLKRAGYQVGTGVMIGLPGQSVEDLANDLLFMKNLDIDMCGMGPYIESEATPLAGSHIDNKESLQWRLDMTMKMIAVLRIMMPDINIAATTALQAIDCRARTKAISVGANVIMPNITPSIYRSSYSLYDNKPLFLDSSMEQLEICYGQRGDSKHFDRRTHKP